MIYWTLAIVLCVLVTPEDRMLKDLSDLIVVADDDVRLSRFLSLFDLNVTLATEMASESEIDVITPQSRREAYVTTDSRRRVLSGDAASAHVQRYMQRYGYKFPESEEGEKVANHNRLSPEDWMKIVPKRSVAAVMDRLRYSSTALNWVAWCAILGYDPFTVAPFLGAGWYERVKALSSLALNSLPVCTGLSVLTELHTLKGFTPVDLDLPKAAREFASSGRNLTSFGEDLWIKQFDQVVFPRFWPRYTQFRPFVESGVWQTSGSAGSGYSFTARVDAKAEEFRATKNQLIDQLDVDSIVAFSTKKSRQLNTVIVKNEVTKARLAVSAPTNWYFATKWLEKMVSPEMQRFPEIVGDESASEARERIETFRSLARGKWVLSFDFRKFDHQMSLKILARILEAIRERLRPLCFEQERLILDNVVWSLENAELRYQDDGRWFVVPVTGGLPSGTALTTFIANVFNYVFCTLANALSFWVKGDDSFLVFRSRMEAMRFMDLMEKMGVDFDRAKSFVLFERGQFLRQFIAASPTRKYQDSVLGISAVAARAIAAAHQSKPWSNPEYRELVPLVQSAKALSTAVARVRMVWPLHRVRELFDRPVFRVPAVYGGFGVLPTEAGDPEGYSVETKFPVVAYPSKLSDAWRTRILCQENSLPDSRASREIAREQWVSTLNLKGEYQRKPYGRYSPAVLVPGNFDLSRPSVNLVRLRWFELEMELSWKEALMKESLRAYDLVMKYKYLGLKQSFDFVTSGCPNPVISPGWDYLCKMVTSSFVPNGERNFLRDAYSQSWKYALLAAPKLSGYEADLLWV